MSKLYHNQGTKACHGREIPTVQRNKERDEAKKKRVQDEM